MRVFLLPMAADRYTGYFEEEPVSEDKENNESTEPKNRWQRIKANLAEGYRRLEKKRPMSERLVAQLRKKNRIEVVYPSDLSPDEARDLFRDFIQRQAQHERSWKKWDAVLACLGAPLFFLPGPNVWFYYPAIRALGHHYAESGCKKVLKASDRDRTQPRIQFTPSADLAEVKRLVQTQGRKRLNKAQITQIGQRLGLTALGTLYK